jgi:hypothetical protein
MSLNSPKAERRHSSFGLPDRNSEVEQAVSQRVTRFSQAQNHLTSVDAEAYRSVVDSVGAPPTPW